MEMKYCSKSVYEALYGSYLRSDPNVLLDAAGIEPSTWLNLPVLDLCGGNGRLSIAARKRGAMVRMVDADSNMSDIYELGKYGIDIRIGRVENMLQERFWQAHPPLFAAIFCQQAINYWLTKYNAIDVKHNMTLGGVFVFNTFNTLPPTIPVLRTRDMGDHNEYEVFYSTNNMVHHVQMREGFAPHQTSFSWISPEGFMSILEPHFDVERRTDGRTDIYVCRKEME